MMMRTGGFCQMLGVVLFTSELCWGNEFKQAFVRNPMNVFDTARSPRRLCPRQSVTRATNLFMSDRDFQSRIRKADQATTFVETMSHGNGKSLVEIGCTNAKREFIVDQHMLGHLPERAAENIDLGTITLVGAGPGDPDLLTVAAVKAIKAADLVVADRLVSQEILSSVECELKIAQKHPGCALQAQQEIYRWCVQGALEGKRVVRLKIGDPFVFGRGGEEVLEFRRFGIEPAVIPGISSALAGPMAAGIPITHRGVANKVVFGTGMGQDETEPEVPAYQPELTAVFLMAVGRLSELSRDLQAAGYPADTPVGICERATTPRQRTVFADLASAAAAAAAAGVRPPAVVVVGHVVNVLRRPEDSDSLGVALPAGEAGRVAAGGRDRRSGERVQA